MEKISRSGDRPLKPRNHSPYFATRAAGNDASDFLAIAGIPAIQPI